MKTIILRIFILATLLSGFTGLPAPDRVQAAAAAPTGASPADMLRPDGSLKPDPAFSGALDLSGYTVRLDAQRGPLFTPQTPGAVQPGEWAALGAGGGAIDGQVRGIAVSGSDVYVAGYFTDAANIAAADYIARWDGASWHALGGDGSGDGSIQNGVYALAVSGSDVYIGGYFTYVYDNGVYLPAADRVAHWDGANWHALGGNGAGDGAIGNGGVFALALDGGNLYVGGTFNQVNNNGTDLPEADYIAKWDGANWSALGSGGGGLGALNGMVNSIAISGTNVYAGGSFFNVNDNGTTLDAADRVARWDGSHWHALGSNGAGDGSIASPVFALAVSGNDLYVGGQFGDVNNNGAVLTAADKIARWDGSNWHALGSSGANGALNNNVNAILVDGGSVYAGGFFTNAGGVAAADHVARWDGSAWHAMGSNGSGDGAIQGTTDAFVQALAVQSGSLLAGGGFYDVVNGGPVTLQADYIAQWDGTNWSALGDEPNGALKNAWTGSHVNAIAVLGGDVYAGGYFYDISNFGDNLNAGDFIARWDGAAWHALGGNSTGDGSLNSEVYSLAVYGSDLVVGGAFTNVSNSGGAIPEADYIARWDGSAWHALGSNGSGDGALPSAGYVYSLAAAGTNLYIGGVFNNAAGLPAADKIARWDGSNWHALGSNGSGDGALGNIVWGIAPSGADVYVVGDFTNAAGLPAADYIARWDGSNWNALGSNGAGDGALGDRAFAVAVSGTLVYAGGSFVNVNDGGSILTAADFIAQWDGSHWSALGSDGSGDGALGSGVWSLAVNGSDLYVGGGFRNVDNNGLMDLAADFIAKWDGSTWSALGSNGAGNGAILTDYHIRAIAFNATTLFAGGYFSNVNNNGTLVKEADYIAAYGLDAGSPQHHLYLPALRRGN